jgi:hypothetical protein
LAGGKSRRDNCASHERGWENAQRASFIAGGGALALAAAGFTILVAHASPDERSKREHALSCAAGVAALSCRLAF